jgi:TPR repeat protein
VTALPSLWPLAGIAIVVIGFALRANPLAVVVAAAFGSGLGAGLSVPEVVARATSPAVIATEAARRYEAGRFDDALLLWEAAAQAGNAAALTRLAGLYDPVGFTPGRPFRDPDPRQAARHYRDAVAGGDPRAAEPRARLRRWLDDRVREGDINAPLTIRDFWQ